MEKFIIGTDVGGTTFSSTLFDNSLHPIKKSSKELINNFNSTHHLLEGISKQINKLIDKDQIGSMEKKKQEGYF